jgi:hypothetical protein
MEKNFKELGRSLRFFNAVDAQTMTDEEIAILSPRVYVGHKSRSLSRGEIACAESFRRVLHEFVEGGDDYLCIAEDDADFSPDALAYLDPATLRRLEPFDVFRLMTDPESGPGPPRIVPPHAAHAVHAPLRLGFFTLAQVFSRAGAQKVLAGLVPLWAPLDNLIYRDAGIVGLRVLEIRPAVVLQRPTPTLIEGRFEDAAARAVKRPLKIELRRKLFLVARRFRAVWSYARARGLRGLCKLRPGW